jgi:hypothetical protein
LDKQQENQGGLCPHTFFGNPSFVSGQAGVAAASLCLGFPLRCPSSSAKVERVVLNALITVTADCRRIFEPSAILSVIFPPLQADHT